MITKSRFVDSHALFFCTVKELFSVVYISEEKLFSSWQDNMNAQTAFVLLTLVVAESIC